LNYLSAVLGLTLILYYFYFKFTTIRIPDLLK